MHLHSLQIIVALAAVMLALPVPLGHDIRHGMSGSGELHTLSRRSHGIILNDSGSGMLSGLPDLLGGVTDPWHKVSRSLGLKEISQAEDCD